MRTNSRINHSKLCILESGRISRCRAYYGWFMNCFSSHPLHWECCDCYYNNWTERMDCGRLTPNWEEARERKAKKSRGGYIVEACISNSRNPGLAQRLILRWSWITNLWPLVLNSVNIHFMNLTETNVWFVKFASPWSLFEFTYFTFNRMRISIP